MTADQLIGAAWVIFASGAALFLVLAGMAIVRSSRKVDD